jgi:VanZ family protein
MNYRYYAPAIVWALVVLLATSIPASSIPKVLRIGINDLDKLIHFVMFAVLGVLLAFAFYKQPEKSYPHKNFFFLAVVIGVVFGLITEGVQHFFISSRSGEYLDLVGNFFGTIFGVSIFRIINPILEENFLKKK